MLRIHAFNHGVRLFFFLDFLLKDLARLIVWALDSYDDVSPIILSGTSDRRFALHSLVSTRSRCVLVFLQHSIGHRLNLGILLLFFSVVGEEDEVSIKDLVYLIAEAADFKGEITVRPNEMGIPYSYEACVKSCAFAMLCVTFY